MNDNSRKEALLPYGRGDLRLSVPGQTKLLRPRPTPPVDDIRESIQTALENPISCKPFSQWVLGAERALVIVPDATRNAYQNEVVPVLLDALNACAVPDDNIRILVGGGAHHLMDESQTRELLGDHTVGRAEVRQHDARDPARLVDLGETARGTPVAVNELVTEADRVIVTGAILPHYFAGFTGGCKGLCPGVAGIETIAANHKLTIDPDPTVGLHPNCKTAVLAGNPVHQDLLEAAHMVGDTFLLNLVGGVDGVVDVVAGDVVDAHERGCDVARNAVRAEIDTPADVVVASCGGYPADVDLVQAHKSLLQARRAVRDEGKLLFVAQCGEGIGSEYVERWLEYGDASAMLQAIHAEYTLNSQTAYSLRSITGEVTVLMRSELAETTLRKIGCRPVGEWSLNLEDIIGSVSPDDTVYVISHAACTLPELA